MHQGQVLRIPEKSDNGFHHRILEKGLSVHVVFKSRLRLAVLHLCFRRLKIPGEELFKPGLRHFVICFCA